MRADGAGRLWEEQPGQEPLSRAAVASQQWLDRDGAGRAGPAMEWCVIMAGWMEERSRSIADVLRHGSFGCRRAQAAIGRLEVSDVYLRLG